MRWKHGRRSNRVINMQGKRSKAAGGGVIFLVIGVVVALLGGNPMPFFSEGIERTVSAQFAGKSDLSEEETAELSDFVSVVLASTEDVWSQIYRQNGVQYQPPSLVLFTGRVQSACGSASASMGPFYCPPDQKVYIDLSFYKELKEKLDAPGDFAQAYVIAHEVGHHVQNLMGILDESNKAKRRLSKARANEVSVRTELQADCFSGVWSRRVQDQYNMIEAGDIDEALNAASQIGDDALQKRSHGHVVPDSFTHGTSAQRKRWFMAGFDTGSIDSCDTFNARNL